MMSTNEHDEV